MSNTFETVQSAAEERTKKIEGVDSQIKELNDELEKFKEKYPQLFLKNRNYFESYKNHLELASKSTWMDHNVQISGDEKALKIESITWREELDSVIAKAKAGAGEKAFELVGLGEKAETWKKNKLVAEITEEKEKYEGAKKLLPKTIDHASFESSPTTPEEQLLFALLLTKKGNEYSEPKKYADIVVDVQKYLEDVLKRNPEIDLAQRSIDDLNSKLDELAREKREL